MCVEDVSFIARCLMDASLVLLVWSVGALEERVRVVERRCRALERREECRDE